MNLSLWFCAFDNLSWIQNLMLIEDIPSWDDVAWIKFRLKFLSSVLWKCEGTEDSSVYKNYARDKPSARRVESPVTSFMVFRL